LVDLLKAEFSAVEETVSCTTRAKRPLEQEGVEYFFLSKEAFQKKVEEGAFLEYNEVLGEFYGTLKTEVFSRLRLGRHVVAVIDVKGALQIKKQMEAAMIFIRPPSVEELKKRLEKRNTEKPEEIVGRLKLAEAELKLAEAYDYFILNDNIQEAYQVLKAIFIAEEHRNRRTKLI
jgi:guanylate kinase